ncbi:DUF4129 domain-containing protein [Rhodocaloribacter sp.]
MSRDEAGRLRRGAGRALIAALALVCLTATARAQTPEVRTDTARVVVRTPPPDALARYRSDPAFDYDRSAAEAPSLMERIKAWLWEHVFRPLGASALRPVWRFVYYAVVAAAMVFLLLRLLRMDVSGVLRGKKTRVRPADLLEEDLATVDFDAGIEAAAAAGDYRRAVRLFYLKALRELADRNLIVWRREKTNHAYVDELRRTPVRRPFAELTYLFEYIWYGEFPVDEAAFGRMRRAFARFDEHLGEG